MGYYYTVQLNGPINIDVAPILVSDTKLVASSTDKTSVVNLTMSFVVIMLSCADSV